MPDDSLLPDFDESMLPTGFDRGGDGATIWGTPSSDGAITAYTAGNEGTPGVDLFFTEELDDSPEIERAEQGTITKRFKCTWTDAQTWILLLHRGVMLVDSAGNFTKVLSCNIQAQPGDSAIVRVVSEFVDLDTPPDEFDLDTVQLNVDIIKHPRYFFSLNPNPDDASNLIDVGDLAQVSISSVKQSIIRAIQTYRDSPFFPSASNVNGLVQNNINSTVNGQQCILVQYQNDGFVNGTKETDPPFWNGNVADLPDGNWRYALVPVPVDTPEIQLAIAAASEITSKIWQGVDTPYIAGVQMTHSIYSFRPPSFNPGGYVENPYDDGVNVDFYFNPIPVASPELPVWFYSTEFPPDPALTIFDNMPQWNPTGYSDTGTKTGLPQMSWLRQADKIHYERTWYKLTRTWIGSPVGHWDSEIFGQLDRPSVPSDYVTSTA